jgi:hypothetical protein
MLSQIMSVGPRPTASKIITFTNGRKKMSTILRKKQDTKSFALYVGARKLRSRAFFSGPASTGSKPSTPTRFIIAGFFSALSPATSMSGFTGYSAALGHIVCARCVERVEHERAGCPASDPLASRSVEAENEL